MRRVARLALATALAMAWGLAPARSDYAAGAVFYARKNYEEAFAQLLPEARGGDARAQLMLGVMYDLGQHVAVDKAAAAQWYGHAAAQGHPDAQFRLAVLLYAGDGVIPDREAAYRWALLAAEGARSGARRERAGALARHVAKLLTESQIASAQAAVRAWVPRLAAAPERAGSPTPRLRRSGTGIFIDKEGSLLTALHVVHPSCERLMISYGDEPAVEAQVGHFDLMLDLVLLRSGAKPARIAAFSPQDQIARGTAITIAGYALAVTKHRRLLAASGVVIDQMSLAGAEGFFRTSVPILPGQSGGPVLDGEGRVLGLAKAQLARERPAAADAPDIGRSLAVGGSALIDFLERAKAAKQVQRPEDIGLASETRLKQASRFLGLVECWGG